MQHFSLPRTSRASLLLAAFIAAPLISFGATEIITRANDAATVVTAGMTTPAQQQPNIDLGGFFATDRAPKGRATQAVIVMDIPGGFHVNANRPLGKYAVPTVVKIEAPDGVRVSPVTYPRAVVRRFKFSDEQLGVYEGRAVMRFNVTVPPNYGGDRVSLRTRIRYQSCSDDVCFQPATRDVQFDIPVASANEQVRRVNTALFGGGRRRRR